MEVIVVRDLLNIDTISKVTDAWKKLIEVADSVTGDVQFDFRGIQLIEPWTNDDFKQLMKNDKVYLKVYTSETVQKTIEIMLAIGHLKTNRVENEDILSDPTLSDREKKIRDAKKSILDNTKDTDKGKELDLGQIRSYITESITVDALKEAIDEILETQPIKHYKVILSGVTIIDAMLMKLAELANYFEEKGVFVEMESSDDEVISKIMTFQCIGTRQLTSKEKFEIIKQTIKPKMVGMLTKYARTGRLDSLGRMGDGQPIMCRPAIFEGFIKKDNVIMAKFTTFPLQTFYTKQDYYLDNDNARLKKPRTEVMCMPIPDIGICDKFTGREFHFNMPIQLDPNDSLTTSKVKDGKVETVKVLLPEFIKMVLDDHDIEYDASALLDAIIETRRLLKNKM